MKLIQITKAHWLNIENITKVKYENGVLTVWTVINEAFFVSDNYIKPTLKALGIK